MKRILLPALAGLALFTAGCTCPKSEVRYVNKDSVPVYTVSPQFLGEWEGKLTAYEDGKPTKTYDCSLEIRPTGTWILRGFGEDKEIPGNFMPSKEDRINGSFDVFGDSWDVTAGSKDEIIITRDTGKAGEYLITFKRKK